MLKPGSGFASVDEALVALGDQVGEAGRRARVAYIEHYGAPPNGEVPPAIRPRICDRDVATAIERSDLTPDEIDNRDRIQLKDIWSREFFARDESHAMAPMPRLDPAEALETIKDASAALASETESVLVQLDELATLWGDEGVFRTCRDRLRKALGEFKATGAEGGGA